MAYTRTIQGLCEKCGIRPQALRHPGAYRNTCHTCKRSKNYKRNVTLYERPYRRYLKPYCERCGFIPEHECQLDVDHIDENNANNDPSNLQTLCANCHRLKTWKVRNP